MRQGDPLSPSLFCIAEVVLSRRILKLRTKGLMNYISSPRGALAPSHAFYVADLIVFSRAYMKSVQSLMKLIDNNIKKTSNHRLHGYLSRSHPIHLSRSTIFRCSPKGPYFKKIVNRIVAKLAIWKGMVGGKSTAN